MFAKTVVLIPIVFFFVNYLKRMVVRRRPVMIKSSKRKKNLKRQQLIKGLPIIKLRFWKMMLRLVLVRMRQLKIL